MSFNISLEIEQSQRQKNDLAAREAQVERETNLYPKWRIYWSNRWQTRTRTVEQDTLPQWLLNRCWRLLQPLVRNSI